MIPVAVAVAVAVAVMAVIVVVVVVDVVDVVKMDSTCMMKMISIFLAFGFYKN